MQDDIKTKTATFFAQYPVRAFGKREIIIRAETELPGVFYLIEGRVSQYDITPSGNEVVVNVFKPGAFFPMSAALNNTPNYYFFEASTNIKVHIAPPEAAVLFLQNNPDVTFDLLKRVYKGADGVLRRMAHLMGGDAKHRLLFEILNAAYRFGEPQKDGSIRVPLHEGDLARQSGLARETVNRHIQAFKSAGWIEVGHQGMIIKDMQKLESLLNTTV